MGWYVGAEAFLVTTLCLLTTYTGSRNTSKSGRPKGRANSRAPRRASVSFATSVPTFIGNRSHAAMSGG